MSGPSVIPCHGCGHQFGSHKETDKRTERGRCLAFVFKGNSVEPSVCPCNAFVWEPYEEDPDALYDGYKAGYLDINGDSVEPPDYEPSDY